MGLDISVYKVVPRSEDDNDLRQGSHDFHFDENNNNLKIFSDLSFEKEAEYYDLEKTLSEMGYDPKKMLATGQSYSDKAEITYVNTNHILYESYDYLDKIWSKVYFDTKEELFNSVLYEKFKNLYLNILKKEGWVEDYTFYASGQDRHCFNLNKAKDFCSKKVKVVLVDPPTFKKPERFIRVEEVGYQRKGANNKFYQDGDQIYNDGYITDIEVLRKHWYKYFSDTKELMEGFKKSIIDNFTQGETFVSYSW